MKMIASPNSRWRSSSSREHLRLHHHVERRGRLVGDQEPRLAGQRQPDQHALALAARELVRVGARAPRGQPHELEQLAHALRDACRPRLLRVQPDGLGDLVAHALNRVERVERALKDDRQLGPAHRAQPPRPHLEARPRRRAAPRRSPSTPGAAAAAARPQATTCRSPTRPRGRASRPTSSVMSTPRTAGTGAGDDGGVGHVEVPDLEQAHPRLSLSRGSRISSSAVPQSVKASDHEHDPDARAE